MKQFERCAVHFSGRSAEERLTWGQIAIWDVIAWLAPSERHTLNLSGVIEIPEARTVDVVLGVLRTLVERHESLHTLYRPDGDDAVQCVVGTGAIDVDIYEAEPGDVVAQARKLGAESWTRVFDPATELPLRIAVLTADGAPKAIVLTACHMAVDGWSFRIVRDDLSRLLADPTGASLTPAAQEPIERAAFERSPIALRREQRALDFWERHVRELPAAMLSKVDGGETTPLQWAEIDSRAMALAVTALAARTQSPTSAIMLALTTLLLARLTDEDSAAVRILVATRFKTETERLVGAFNENALFVLDLQDESVDDYLRRAATASSLALRNSEYHPRSLEVMVERVTAERNIVTGGYCFFNDVRYDVGRGTDAESMLSGMTVIDEALADTTVMPLDDTRTQIDSKFFVYLRGDATRFTMQLCAHPRFLHPQSPSDFLFDLEWVAVAMARENLSMAALRQRLVERQDLNVRTA